MRSSTARCGPGRPPPMLAARQKSERRLRASSGPPRASPSASITALTAPAEVPDDPDDVQPAVLQQVVEHAPGEGAVRAAALEGEADRLCRLRRLLG